MKVIVKVIVLVSVILLMLWFLITQPLFVINSEPNSKIVVSTDLLKSHVKDLSQILPSRGAFGGGLMSTVEWIEQQLKPLGNVHRQTFKVKDSNFHNIIISFGPSNADKTIVLGAHYDTAHGFPGADDNASGVAVLIEVARLLSSNNLGLKKQVQLIFYPLEESPFFRTSNMGSYIHASSLRAKKKKVELMISVEMVGFFSEEKGSQNYPVSLMNLFYPDKGNFIAIIGNRTSGGI